MLLLLLLLALAPLWLAVEEEEEVVVVPIRAVRGVGEEEEVCSFLSSTRERGDCLWSSLKRSLRVNG